MTDKIENSDVENKSDNQDDVSANPNRRRMLMMGAVAATTAVSVRPAMAQSSISLLTCEIQIPGPHGFGNNIAPDGSLVPRTTPGSFDTRGHNRFNGEDMRNAVFGHDLPGLDYAESRAYVNYVQRLTPGQSGFTCYASIIRPRY